MDNGGHGTRASNAHQVTTEPDGLSQPPSVFRASRRSSRQSHAPPPPLTFYEHIRLPYYVAYPYQNAPRTYTTYTQEGRIMLPFDEKWFRGKLVLNFTALVLAFIIFALACIFLKEVGEGYDVGQASVIIAMAQLICVSAELLALHLRIRRDNVRRGIHPLYAVWIQGVIFALCVFAMGFAIVRHGDITGRVADCETHLLDANPKCAYCHQDPRCSYTAIFASGTAYYYSLRYLPTMRALTAMFVLAAMTHFALFTCAVVDLDQRRRLRSAVLVMPQRPNNVVQSEPVSPVEIPYHPSGLQEVASNRNRDGRNRRSEYGTIHT